MKKSIVNCDITEEIHESSSSLVYRAVQKQDRVPVILKILQPANPGQEDLSRFQYEYDITSGINNDGIIKILSMKEYGNTLLIIAEDIGAESLDKVMKRRNLTLKECLFIAVRIAEILGHIHAAKVIHKNINPSNIIWNPKTGQIKIIDFGIASRFPSESLTFENPDHLKGTLAYISPEQTGRVNRSLDYRTDLYSLGVALYEMLTGQLPFPASERLELVHCHIAKTPSPVCEISADIPQVVSDIIMKLLEKNAEDRYQSPFGLKYDLEKCQEQLASKQNIKDLQFELGQNDFSGRFEIPQTLYGRESEINTLLQAFERASTGQAELMLVAGYSGVGKTALVYEIHRATTEKNGFFAAGKFDQLQRSIPYSAITQAFNQFCRYLLMGSKENLARWKSKILGALGNNGQIIIDIIPDLELVVGNQPSIANVGPIETQNRFQMYFLNFIKVLCDEDHPFILFIDDLQWIDSASMDLLKTIIFDDEVRHLLIVGAYRDNEVNQSHPLMLTLDEIRNERDIVNLIILDPLDLETTNSLIANSMQCDSETTLQLSQLCYKNTNGNPFFLKQYIFDLVDKGFISFENNNMVWNWDFDNIQETECSDNVVELIIGKIWQLPVQTRELLSYAACIGIEFSIKNLSIICKIEEAQILQNFLPAVKARVILPTDQIYADHEVEGNTNYQYKFLHDNIQQAALSLIQPEKFISIHYQIGLLLWENFNELELEQHLFEIVDHLNIGVTESTGEKERSKLASLNFNAGKKAKTSIAYRAAKEYFLNAYELLPSNSWETNYSLTLQYCLEKGELEYLNSDWESAAATLEIARENSKNILDQTTVSRHKASMYRMKNDLKISLDIALEALQKLDINIKAFPDEKEIAGEISSFLELTKDLGEDELFNLPELSEPVRIIAMSLLYECFAPAYLLGSPLVSIIGVLMSKITIKEGNCSYSSIGYIFLSAITFANSLKDFDNAYKFGNLAIKINDQIFHNKEFEACIFDMWGTFVCHHKDPIERAKEDLLRGFNSGLENGSYQWGVYSGIIYTFMSLWGPGTLKDLAAAFDKVLPPSRRVEFHIAQWGYAAKATAHNITEEVEDRTVFSDKVWPDLHSFMESRDVSTMLVDSACKISLANWFSDLEKALEYADKGDQYLASAPGVYFNTVFRFHQALAYTSAFEKIDEKSKSSYLMKIKSILSDFELFAEKNPVTYLHQLLIIKAEIKRIDGDIEEAMNLYDSAIDSARESGFLHNEAFASELAARFFFSLNKERIGNAYIKESYYAYYKWGATAKLTDLEKKFPQLLTQTTIPGTSAPVAGSSQPETTISSTAHQQTPSIQLDLESVMKASHILSDEIVLSSLLKKMMHILIENAGATRGLIILKKDRQWVIAAEGFSDIDEIAILQTLPIEEGEQVPVTLINYIANTREKVVLSDATQEGAFTQDQYIVNQRPKSVLGLPLINGDQLKGILYLENKLTTGTFTADKLHVINLLAFQAGISLENAILFDEKQKYAEKLVEEVAERKQAEVNLRESENRHRTLFESMVQGVVYQDRTGTITSANPAAEHMLGLTLDQMVGRTSVDPRWKTIHEDGSDFPGDTHPAMVSLKSGKPVKDEIMGVFNPQNQKYTWINTNSIPRFNTGENEPYQVYTTFEDITERKKAEAENVKLNEKLQQAHKMEAIGTLAGGIAHDFNNILGAILGYTEMAREDSPKGSTVSKDLDRVLEASYRAKDLVKQILAFSKQDDVENFHLQSASIVREAIKMLRPSLPTTIEINENIEPEVGLIFADPTKIHQIVMNLGTNAFHAMEESGGKLDISLKEATLSTEDLVSEPGVKAGTFVKLSICDSGSGIAPDIKDKIFDPYFSTKETGKGTGMGLSIVHGIVKNYGGFISLYSEPGESTAFHVFLPVIEKDVLPEIETVEEIAGGKERILFIDDEEILAEMGKHMLERLGYHATVRKSSLEALETFQNQPDQFDIVITDQTMPGMTGTDLARRMIQIRPDIPIILCTGYSTIISEEKAKGMGIREFAMKPLSKKDIAVLIRKVLDT